VSALLLLLALIPRDDPCRDVPGSAALLEPGAIVLLGEVHGTREAPAAAGDLVCLARAAGLEVVVGLEIPVSESESLESYLASDGGGAARRALLARPFWSREYQDGRSSRAMLELLERLRRADPLPRVVAIDDPDEPAGRDAAMAAALSRAAGELPGGLVVALTGNLHNRLEVGTAWDPALRPAGRRLAETHPSRVVSVELGHAGGTAWVCTGSTAADCGVLSLPLRPRRDSGRVVLAPAEAEGVDARRGELFLGAVTASPPAKQSEPPGEELSRANQVE